MSFPHGLKHSGSAPGPCTMSGPSASAVADRMNTSARLPTAGRTRRLTQRRFINDLLIGVIGRPNEPTECRTSKSFLSIACGNVRVTTAPELSEERLPAGALPRGIDERLQREHAGPKLGEERRLVLAAAKQRGERGRIADRIVPRVVIAQ